MSLFNQHTYPSGMPVSVNVESSNPVTMTDYEVFEVTDDIDNFEAIPTKLINKQWDNPGGTLKSIAIPLLRNSSQEFDIENFKRRLYVNQKGTWGTATGNKQFIKINRPSVNGTPKKAYLHSVIYAAYDFNDMLPYFDDSILGTKSDSTPLTLEDMTVDNVFGTDEGLIVKPTAGGTATDPDPSGLHGRQAAMIRSSSYTTAHYPVTRPIYTKERENEITAMDRLGQAGLRSSIRGGLLPSDIFKNNFKLTIGGIESSTPTAGAPFAHNIFATGNDKNSFNNDNVIPAYNNEIDIEIPDSVQWLGVEVAGMGWAHGIDWKQMPTNVKLLYQVTGHLITYVQMPVKVSIAINYV